MRGFSDIYHTRHTPHETLTGFERSLDCGVATYTV